MHALGMVNDVGHEDGGLRAAEALGIFAGVSVGVDHNVTEELGATARAIIARVTPKTATDHAG